MYRLLIRVKFCIDNFKKILINSVNIDNSARCDSRNKKVSHESNTSYCNKHVLWYRTFYLLKKIQTKKSIDIDFTILPPKILIIVLNLKNMSSPITVSHANCEIPVLAYRWRTVAPSALSHPTANIRFFFFDFFFVIQPLSLGMSGPQAAHKAALFSISSTIYLRVRSHFESGFSFISGSRFRPSEGGHGRR